jgi:L-lactate dehydrogenase (cytochrome)
VLKALAMGAKGTYIGRAYVYGLGAKGQQGVTDALNVIHKELEMSMGLCGRTDVNTLDRDILMTPKGFSGDWDA